MKSSNTFINMINTLPAPKYFTENPKGNEVKAKTPFIVIKGTHRCLARGMDSLRGKKGVEIKNVYTPFETMQRKMKIVFVQEYDPVTRHYEDLGDFWADVVTGSLYDQFSGDCLSSDMMKLVLE